MLSKRESDKMEYWVRVLLERVSEVNKKDDGKGLYPITFELPLIRLSEIMGVDINNEEGK